MAIRFAAASALAFAVLVSGPAQAQFFLFGGPQREYALSPREIVGMLDDEGYSLRGPMMRRGGVYVCNVVSVSGRQVRLIVDARNGHIVQRYAVRGDGFEDGDRSTGERSAAVRPPRDVGREDGDDDFGSAFPRQRQALDDPSAPLRRDDAAPARGDDFNAPSDAPKPKRHTAKKHAAPTAVAKAPATPLTPDAVPAPTPKPEPSPTTAAVAPSTPTPELKKPVEEVKPVEVTTPAPVAAAPPAPAPAPAPSVAPAPPSPPVQAKAETRSVEAPKADTPPAKPEPARKKLNDLPVGTLD